jgi:hypothetical protein
MNALRELVSTSKTTLATPLGKAVAIAAGLVVLLGTFSIFSGCTPAENDVEAVKKREDNSPAVRKPDVAPGEREAKGKLNEAKGKEPEEKPLRGKIEDVPLTKVPVGPNPLNIRIGEAWRSDETLDRVTKHSDGTVTLTRIYPPDDTRLLSQLTQPKNMDGTIRWSESEKRYYVQFVIKIGNGRSFITTMSFTTAKGLDQLQPTGDEMEIAAQNGRIRFIEEQEKLEIEFKEKK